MVTMTSETTETLSALFPGRFDSLVTIVDFVTAAAQAAQLDERSVDAVQLAVDEAFSNIIEHAYGGEDRGDVSCACYVMPGRLTVILSDSGRSFDPALVPEPNLCDDIEARDEGGLGLYLMRQLMDDVCFQFHPQLGNTVTMVKLAKKRI